MKISLILLGAGNSKRFGSNKLLYKVNGKEMFKHSLDLACSLREKFEINDIIVVSKYPEIIEYAKTKNIIYVENPHSERGISSSILLGIERAEKNIPDYLIFMVCDQPYLRFETLKDFLGEFLNQEKNIGAVSYGGVMGNPCIFSTKYIENLKNLSGDRGGKKIIKENLGDVYCYEVLEEKELKDIDFLNKKA